MKLLTVLTFCLLAQWSVQAQGTATLQGNVREDGGAAVAYANVILHNTTDSSLVKAEFSDENGNFAIRNLTANDYWLEISYVGLPTYASEAFRLAANETKTLPNIQMAAAATDLAEVTVKAQRAIIEVHPDKTVFNVDGTVNAAGSDAFELLRKSPGVIVDNNDNLLLQGKNGVRVYIDGKPSPLSAADLANFLRGISATEIDAIEIITNPSARYEAEGNAGIINIRMKRNRELGTNGTAELGFSQGFFPKYNAGLSLNHRNAHINAYGKIGANKGQWRNENDFLRFQSGTRSQQKGVQINDGLGYNFRAGADWFPAEHHTIGFLVSGYFNDNDGLSESRSEIGPIGAAPENILSALNENTSDRDNLNANLNYRFDGGKQMTWNIDADYSRYRNDGNTYQPNIYFDATESNVLLERIFGNNQPTDIDQMALKIDHERPFAGGKLSTGAKVSLVTTDNTFEFFNYIDGSPVYDPQRSNRFKYDENINAIYAQYQRQLSEKWSVQAGLRIEHTHSMGDLTSEQDTEDKQVKRDYVDPFPSAGISWQINPKNALRLGYSYRIDRPNYQDLNPFENQLDELTFERGNPFLGAQYTHKVELGHTFNYRYSTTLSYSETSDLITQIVDTLSGNRAFISQRNLAKQRVANLNISAPITLAEWWSVYVNTGVSYLSNEGVFEEGKSVNIDNTFFNGYVQNTFQLSKTLSLEVSGWYQSPSVWGGNFESMAMGSVDAGLTTKLMQERLRLTVGVSDIFRTQQWSGISTFGGLTMRASGNWESRRLKVNMTYNFGSSEVKSSRRRSTGLEDERKRVGGGE